MPKLSIHLFGLPQFFLDETLLKVERRKTMALLAYLGASGSSSREVVSALLWPDCSQEQAGAYLRQALWDFNKVAGEGPNNGSWIERDGAALRLCPRDTVQVDTNLFETHLGRWKALSRGQAGAGDVEEVIYVLEEAVCLYKGDFLAGFTLRDCPEFDEWQTLQAEGLRLKLAEALEALAKLHGERGRYDQALAHGRRWLSLDELNESAHREIMRLYDESGQRSAALRQYEACQRRLQEELGVAPEQATTLLFQQISARRKGNVAIGARVPGEKAQPSADAAITRPAASGGPVPVFLPSQPTTFFGREQELAQIKSMLANPECRLITLVGPGGTGKTRLAIEAAGQSIGYPHGLSFPHGIYFAGMASTNSASDILSSIAGALKLDFRSGAGGDLSPDAAREQLQQFLSGKKILLVLDNLEQVTGSAGLFSELLASAADLKLIATSRVRLNLPEEWVIEVSGLPYPEDENDSETAHYPAVQLFARSAERAGQFSPTPGDWPVIARICRMVEGLPLGIELAAAWARMLSCEEIAAEITRSLDFLESNRPGTPERQRSLRGVFEHSWQLLTDTERSIFRRLSVFRGGFTRETAFQVAGASLNLLAVLTDKSLLRRVSSGRFDLHEPVKQYAAEKLAADPDTLTETEMRHAAYFAGWLRQQGLRLRGCEQVAALSALRAEQQNLRRAWSWLVENRQLDLLHLIVSEIILFYEMSGDHANGRDAMTQVVDMLRRQETGTVQAETFNGLLGLGLAGLRHFNRSLGQFEKDSLLQVESIAICQALPAKYTRAFICILSATGPGTIPQSDLIPMVQESAATFQTAGDLWGCGLAYEILGDLMTFSAHPKLPSARAAYETGLAFFSQAGSDYGRALCLFGLTFIARSEGYLSEAHQRISESLEIYQRMGNINRIFDVRSVLAGLDEAMGNLDEAREMLNANLAVLVNAGEQNLRKQYEAWIERLSQGN